MKTFLRIFALSTAIFLVNKTNSFAQEKISIMAPNDAIEIYSSKTGLAFERNCGLNKDLLITTFGEPDSVNTVDVTALGGYVFYLYYNNNYFYVPADGYASNGFVIGNSDFYLVINDTIKIKVGSNTEQLMQIISPDRNVLRDHIMGAAIKTNLSKVGVFVIPYGYLENDELREAGHWLEIYYNPDSQKIIGIIDYFRS